MLIKEPNERCTLEEFLTSKWITNEKKDLKETRANAEGVDKFLAFTSPETKKIKSLYD